MQESFNCPVCNSKMRNSLIDGTSFLSCDFCDYEVVSYKPRLRSLDLFRSLFGVKVSSRLGLSAEDLVNARRKKDAERRKRTKKQLQADPTDKRHGTYSGYSYGCRCSRCSAAKDAYKARKRMEKRHVS